MSRHVRGRYTQSNVQNRFGANAVGGAYWRHLTNAIELSMCSGDAAFRQITLTTYYDYYY